MQRGQAALEYIIIIGAVIVIITPIFYYSIVQSSENIRLNEVNDAVQSLTKKADSLYALGEGSRDYVWITIPSGVEYSQIENNSILIHSSKFGDVTTVSKAKLIGDIPTTPGTYKMKIEVLGDFIYIGPINDTTPPEITATSPTGTIGITNPLMTATTNEAAVCRYDSSDKDYYFMESVFSGSGIGHTSQLSGLSEGGHIYYARCADGANNVMMVSASISFNVNPDTSSPVVTNVNASPRLLSAGKTTCVSADVEDDGIISKVWATINVPLAAPFPTLINYTLFDNANGCDGAANDGLYGAPIVMQVPGYNTLISVFAEDSIGNIGSQQPYPNILINVTTEVGEGPGQGFTHVLPTSAYYYVTPNYAGITPKDSEMSTLTDVLLSVTDDDKNTPPSSQRFYFTSVQNAYEGFILELNEPKENFNYITLRIKVVDSEIIPYQLLIYPYEGDGDTIMLTNITSFTITEVAMLGASRGFNEVPIKNVVYASNLPYVKVRVAATSLMDKKVMHISEADFGVS